MSACLIWKPIVSEMSASSGERNARKRLRTYSLLRMIGRPTTDAKVPPSTRWKMLPPAMKNIVMAMALSTRNEPRSGWMATKNVESMRMMQKGMNPSLNVAMSCSRFCSHTAR